MSLTRFFAMILSLVLVSPSIYGTIVLFTTLGQPYGLIWGLLASLCSLFALYIIMEAA